MNFQNVRVDKNSFLSSYPKTNSKLSQLNQKISLQIEERRLKNEYLQLKQSRAKTTVSYESKWKAPKKASIKFSQVRSPVLERPIIKSEQNQHIIQSKFNQNSETTAFFTRKPILSPFSLFSGLENKDRLLQNQYIKSQQIIRQKQNYRQGETIRTKQKKDKKKYQIQKIDGFQFFQFPQTMKSLKNKNSRQTQQIKIEECQNYCQQKNQKLGRINEDHKQIETKITHDYSSNNLFQGKYIQQKNNPKKSSSKINQYWQIIVKNRNNLLMTCLIAISIILMILQIIYR